MKRKNYLFVALSFAIATVVITSCKKESAKTPAGGGNGDGIVEMTEFQIPHPANFPAVEPIPEDNKMYLERVLLGRMLFFDTRLSNNGESCNTCHKAEYGFSMDGVSASDNGQTALPLINLAWYKQFMWNGRIVGSLEDVMFAEITIRFKTDMDKVNAIADYRSQFKKYYGVDDITAEDLAKPLAQYMRALVSKNTKWDRYNLGYTDLTIDEQRGMDIFTSETGDCFHCHTRFTLNDNMMHNNGLDSVYPKYIDKGYYNFTNNTNDIGKFRTPNLRNVALRTSYMHDGRFKTLEEVVEFYNSGVVNDVEKVPNIDPLMLKPNRASGSLGLNELQKQQLVAFLKTFTDSTMITDTLFRNPFQ